MGTCTPPGRDSVKEVNQTSPSHCKGFQFQLTVVQHEDIRYGIMQ